MTRGFNHEDLLLIFVSIFLLFSSPARGQVFFPRVDPLSQIPFRYDLSQSTQFELIDGITETRLRQLDDYIAEKHWEEAILLLQSLMELNDRRLIPVSPSRLIPLSDYCRIRLAQLPPEGLAIYRGRLEASASECLQEAKRCQLPDSYRKVVERAFATRACAEALMALGDLALEAGKYTEARAWWSMALPLDSEAPAEWKSWLSMPAGSADPAAIRARLVLASILEGDLERARAEFEAFLKLHSQAEGYFAGKFQAFSPILEQLLAEAEKRSAALRESATPTQEIWPTFGGNFARWQKLAGKVFPLSFAWQRPLPSRRAGTSPWRMLSPQTFAAAGNSASRPLMYHPVIVGDNVFLATSTEILAWNIQSGEPAWPGGPSIYRDPAAEDLASMEGPEAALGLPQFTLTVSGNRLVARMGSPVTIRTPEVRGGPFPTTALVCLDLEAQGRLIWRQTPPEPNSVFEGTPVCDGDQLYTVLRRNEVQTQLWVAAYRLATGQLLWKQLICIGEPLGRVMLPEATHILLTLAEGNLFLVTNLGAIAALGTDGRIRWVVTYPRERRVDLADLPAHWLRQPTAALFDRGILYVAPADTPMILAIDATTGQLLWYTGPETASATFLLGISGGRLIAGGGRLFWIGTLGEERGRVVACWPESAETPGYGKGLLVGNVVLWPTRGRLYAFDARSAQPIKLIPLIPWEVEGGHLILARGHLLIAGSRSLAAFRLQSASPSTQPVKLSATAHSLTIGASLLTDNMSLRRVRTPRGSSGDWAQDIPAEPSPTSCPKDAALPSGS
jgi:outer membrane protein assembly factor BamB